MVTPLPPGRTRPCTCNAWRVPGLDHEPGCAQIVRPGHDHLLGELVNLFVHHQRPGIGVCTCGGMGLGESYPEHLADALLDGPLRQLIADRDELVRALDLANRQVPLLAHQRDEARAQVDRVRDLADVLEAEAAQSKTGGTSYLQGQRVADAANRVRRALDGEP